MVRKLMRLFTLVMLNGAFLLAGQKTAVTESDYKPELLCSPVYISPDDVWNESPSLTHEEHSKTDVSNNDETPDEHSQKMKLRDSSSREETLMMTQNSQNCSSYTSPRRKRENKEGSIEDQSSEDQSSEDQYDEDNNFKNNPGQVRNQHQTNKERKGNGNDRQRNRNRQRSGNRVPRL